jgi:hypothetical protein
MAAMVVLIELVGFGGAERRIVVASEDPGLESAGCEVAKYTVEVVEEYVFIAGLYRVAEEVFAPGVAECNELSVPFHALWANGADVVITDAFSDGPLRIRAVVGWVIRRKGL